MAENSYAGRTGGLHGNALRPAISRRAGERLALPYADGQGGRGAIGASRATMGWDARTGKQIPFKPKALYRLDGTEYLMRIE